MKIKLDIINETKCSLPSQKDIEDTILDVLKKKSFNIDCEIDIKIVEKTEIQKLNKKYRHLNKPTDVLSFPQYEKPPKSSKVPIALGDIIICPECATNDILTLVKHSTLHLLGYHHT